jgi:hypothetical protein
MGAFLRLPAHGSMLDPPLSGGGSLNLLNPTIDHPAGLGSRWILTNLCELHVPIKNL